MQFFLRVLCVSLVEFRLLYLVHAANAANEINVAKGILSGHPVWKILESRLLGPELVHVAVSLTHLPFSACYWSVCFGLVVLANGVCDHLFAKLDSVRGHTWLVMVAYAVFFVGMQDNIWSYIWDYVDLTTMLLFAWAIVFGASLTPLVILCLVEVLNRESAQFIALWIIVQAVSVERKTPSGYRVKINFIHAAVGAVLLAACHVWTNYARDRFTISEVGTPPEGIRFLGGQMWMLPHQFVLLRSASVLTIFMLALFLATLLTLLWKRRSNLVQPWRMGLVVAAIVGANLCFAVITELRVWFVLLPLIPCLLCLEPGDLELIQRDKELSE